MALSPRGQANADQLSIPWRFAKRHTYDPITNPTGLISFATAENCLIQKELHDFISRIQIPSAALRYAFSTAGGPRLPSAFATHVNEYFAPYWEVGGADVRVTAAATSLHDVLAYSLCKEGEGILTSRPYYGRFELDFGNKAGVKLVPVDTDHEECFGEGVVQAFEEALKASETRGVKIRAVLIINPHNPLGKCYPQATLVALMRFCHLHALHFIADEVYALSVFPNPSYPSATPFTSALSIDPAGIIDPNLIHATYGLSKDFGLAGLKVGCLITRNEELKRAVTAVQRFTGVSGLSVAVATSMLEEREWVREIVGLSRSRLAQAYAFITGRLKQVGIAFLEGGNAGFFVWVDLSPWLPPKDDEGSEDERMVSGKIRPWQGEGETRGQRLARKFVENGVFLQPGEEHGRVGWFRVVFSLERGVVEEGLRRIEETLKGIKWRIMGRNCCVHSMSGRAIVHDQGTMHERTVL